MWDCLLFNFNINKNNYRLRRKNQGYSWLYELKIYVGYVWFLDGFSVLDMF